MENLHEAIQRVLKGFKVGRLDWGTVHDLARVIDKMPEPVVKDALAGKIPDTMIVPAIRIINCVHRNEDVDPGDVERLSITAANNYRMMLARQDPNKYGFRVKGVDINPEVLEPMK
jgi:hypothetical protein